MCALHAIAKQKTAGEVLFLDMDVCIWRESYISVILLCGWRASRFLSFTSKLIDIPAYVCLRFSFPKQSISDHGKRFSAGM
jgi:hypothetical protein